MTKYTDKQRIDFLEKNAYRVDRDGGYSGSFEIYIPCLSPGLHVDNYAGRFDYKTIREAIDAEMNKEKRNE